MVEAAANVVIMTCQHVQRKRGIFNAPGSGAYFDLSFAHERAVGNTKAWLQGSHRSEVDAFLDSAVRQKPTIRSQACGRQKRTACYFLTYPQMTLTPSLHRAQHSAPASVPMLEIYEPILLRELRKGEFHLAGVLLMCSWLRSGRWRWGLRRIQTDMSAPMFTRTYRCWSELQEHEHERNDFRSVFIRELQINRLRTADVNVRVLMCTSQETEELLIVISVTN